MSMADRDGKIWMDGALVEWRDAKIHVLTHTLHYGCGAFEGVRDPANLALGVRELQHRKAHEHAREQVVAERRHRVVEAEHRLGGGRRVG